MRTHMNISRTSLMYVVPSLSRISPKSPFDWGYSFSPWHKKLPNDWVNCHVILLPLGTSWLKHSLSGSFHHQKCCNSVMKLPIIVGLIVSLYMRHGCISKRSCYNALLMVFQIKFFHKSLQVSQLSKQSGSWPTCWGGIYAPTFCGSFHIAWSNGKN